MPIDLKRILVGNRQVVTCSPGGPSLIINDGNTACFEPHSLLYARIENGRRTLRPHLFH